MCQKDFFIFFLLLFLFSIHPFFLPIPDYLPRVCPVMLHSRLLCRFFAVAVFVPTLKKNHRADEQKEKKKTELNAQKNKWIKNYILGWNNRTCFTVCDFRYSISCADDPDKAAEFVKYPEAVRSLLSRSSKKVTSPCHSRVRPIPTQLHPSVWDAAGCPVAPCEALHVDTRHSAALTAVRAAHARLW